MLKIGEYVRTKRGIAKVLEVKTVQPKMYGKHDVAYLIDKCPRMYIAETEFIKHSKDITDLIEVGDVIEVHFPVRNIIRKIYADEYFEDSMILNGIINGNVILKTILTKEQYMQNCYTVERNEEC